MSKKINHIKLFFLLLVSLLLFCIVVEGVHILRANHIVHSAALAAARYGTTGRPLDEDGIPWVTSEEERFRAIVDEARRPAAGLTINPDCDGTVSYQDYQYCKNIPGSFGVAVEGIRVRTGAVVPDFGGEPGFNMRVKTYYNPEVLNPLLRPFIPGGFWHLEAETELQNESIDPDIPGYILPPERLTAYLDQDMRDLNEAVRYRVIASLDQLMGIDRGPPPSCLGFCPRYFWEDETESGEIRYILLEGWGYVSDGYATEVKVHIFDGKWQAISETTFSTGGESLIGATFRDEPTFDTKVIGIQTESEFYGVRQIYALIDDRVILLRLEDSDGDILRYGLPTSVPNRTVEEWQAILDSDNLPEVLEALLWLSSYPDPTAIDTDEARIMETLRRSSEVKARVVELSQSESPWVTEAADLALDVEWFTSSGE